MYFARACGLLIPLSPNIHLPAAKKPFEKNALKTGGGGVRTSFSSADYANGPSRSAINSDLQRRQNFGKSSPTSSPQ